MHEVVATAPLFCATKVALRLAYLARAVGETFQLGRGRRGMKRSSSVRMSSARRVVEGEGTGMPGGTGRWKGGRKKVHPWLPPSLASRIATHTPNCATSATRSGGHEG